ncbi:hypothetical protein HW555_008451 [Spodoptera exigua]|uniref:Fatty acid desaturase domain-containing protein n=1 Tax=Spodoptera exigua TaxID=7107 RepID=A0A835GB30_SPOEX|nr:hypothetical protein HW555_008451 [Spodoptera exigua]
MDRSLLYETIENCVMHVPWKITFLMYSGLTIKCGFKFQARIGIIHNEINTNTTIDIKFQARLFHQILLNAVTCIYNASMQTLQAVNVLNKLCKLAKPFRRPAVHVVTLYRFDKYIASCARAPVKVSGDLHAILFTVLGFTRGQAHSKFRSHYLLFSKTWPVTPDWYQVKKGDPKTCPRGNYLFIFFKKNIVLNVFLDKSPCSFFGNKIRSVVVIVVLTSRWSGAMAAMSGAPLLLANATLTSKLQDDDHRYAEPMKKNRDYEWQVVWRNVFAFVYLHAAALYGFYLMFTGKVRIWTILFGLLFAIMAGMGVTAGAHRLWAHRSYKARWPLRLFLALMQTMAFQNHIYEWVRDHRVHHKFTETDADPHNARRGFFFSHIGWLMVRKHKDVFEKGATVDMSDLEKDPIVMFQKKTYMVLMPLLCFVIPAWIPCYFWGENPWYSWYVASITRYTVALHFTWLVNSAAHIWGNRPYDKNIGATDNKAVAICAFGEGWHNYHHVFPGTTKQLNSEITAQTYQLLSLTSPLNTV